MIENQIIKIDNFGTLFIENKEVFSIKEMYGSVLIEDFNLKSSGIYFIINTLNGKFYLGSAANFCGRKDKHFSQLRKNNHPNRFLQSAFNKSGVGVWKFVIITLVDAENLLEIEQQYLNKYYDNQKDCYNLAFNATAPSKGMKHSEEARRKISLSKVGVTRSPECVEKIRQSKLGKSLSAEHIKKLSEATRGEKNGMFGKSQTEEVKRKISEANRGEKNGMFKKARQKELETKKKLEQL